MPLSDKQIKELNIKEQLLEAKENIEEQLKKAKKNLDFGDDYGSAWEEEETDEAEEYSNFVGAEQAMKKRLNAIDQALEKIEEGEYGVCEECGSDIDTDVLEASPESILCRDCKKKANKK